MGATDCVMHYNMVRSKLAFTMQKQRKKTKVMPIPKLNVKKLNNPQCLQVFQKQLDKNMDYVVWRTWNIEHETGNNNSLEEG